jgi:hypothetical protein
VKVLSLKDAEAQFASICEEALTGEVIRVRFPGGAELELKSVNGTLMPKPFSNDDLMKSYDDSDWASFENNCGKASD